MSAMMNEDVYREFRTPQDVLDYIKTYEDDLTTAAGEESQYAARVFSGAALMVCALGAYEANPQEVPDMIVGYAIMIASEEIARYEESRKKDD